MMDPLQIVLYAAGFVVLIVATQDIHIFPGALYSKAKYLLQRNKSIPPQVESIFIKSIDGTSLELWRYAPELQTDLSAYTAIIFHGNGGPVENFIFTQMWLAEMGITSYNFDYRGFGRSSGWPSEKGIYQDSDAVWNYLVQRENITPDRVIVVGISVGSGPAARMAALKQPKLLLLASAFTDLKSAVKAQPVVGLLFRFIRYNFPTMDYVSKLSLTHLLIAHGLKDNIIPPNHSVALEAAYCGAGHVRRHTSQEAGHNMAFYDLKNEMRDTISEWL